MSTRLWALAVFALVLGGCTLAVPPNGTTPPSGVTYAAARVSGPLVIVTAHVTSQIQYVEIDEPQGTQVIQADRSGVDGYFVGDTVHFDPFSASVGHHDYWLRGHTVFPEGPGDQPTPFVHLGVDVAPLGGPSGTPVPPGQVGHRPDCSTLPPPHSDKATLQLEGAQPQTLYVNVVEPDCTLALFTPAAGGATPNWTNTFPVVAGDPSVWVGQRLAVYEGIAFHGEVLQGRFIEAFTVGSANFVHAVP